MPDQERAAVTLFGDAAPDGQRRPVVGRWATVSDDGVYRYDLGRRWGRPIEDHGSRVCWVMLNPSTADADLDDPTIRRCIGFSQDWGHDELVVVNLYALRATDPAELGRAEDPVGPGNLAHVDLHMANADRIVVAWGAHPWASKVAGVILGWNYPLHCLGTTKAGHPRHPLYVKGDQPLEAWRG